MIDKMPILLLGAGGHAKACIDVIEQSSHFSIAGLVGAPHEVGNLVLGYPVLGTDADLPVLRIQFTYALVAIGQIKTPTVRKKAFESLMQHGFILPMIVSPQAYVSRHATIGAGTIVMHRAIVNAGSIVGSNCIINTCALVEHDVRIDDHCHLSTRAVLNGAVNVGEGSFIGSASVVREGITIPSYSVIQMGKRILQHVQEQSVS